MNLFVKWNSVYSLSIFKNFQAFGLAIRFLSIFCQFCFRWKIIFNAMKVINTLYILCPSAWTSEVGFYIYVYTGTEENQQLQL